MDACKPWCAYPPEAAGRSWVCPECGARWYVEEHVERLIDWCRTNVEPTMTDSQLAFLRAKLSGRWYSREHGIQ